MAVNNFSSGSHSPKRAPLSIDHVPLDRLQPDPGNARQHSAKQVRQIANSIETFGFNVPILVDAELNVVAGHGRLLACKRLGWREVPTIRLDHLSPEQNRAFMIADNRLAEVAKWDDRLLAEQLQALASVDLDFDIEAIGFDMGEIDLRIESLSSKDAGAAEPPIPVVAGPAVSRLGDFWRLGRHKLVCGDARDPEAHDALMGTECAAAVFSDPPYNVAIDGNVSGLGEVRHREFVMAAGEMTPEAFTSFLEASLAQMKRSSVPGGVAFVCMDWRHMSELLAAARSASLELLNLCVWAKPNAGMGALYRSQHELVFVFKLGAGRHRNNVRLGQHGRNRTNVWSYANGPGFGRAGEEGRLAALHPTVKPAAMVADAILDVTRRGDIVLDPFLGSGATVMACERTGRRGFGLELGPLYVDVIIRRWQAHTGDKARHCIRARRSRRSGARGLRASRRPCDERAGSELRTARSERNFEDSREDEREERRVGYGRPPVATQFRQGVSGNPRGRPKGARNFATVVAATLGERLTITENGRRKRITKLDAVVKQLVNRAAGGEARSIQLLCGLLQASEWRPSPSDLEQPSEADQEVLRELQRRMKEASS